jgi:NAD(P)-dependent dehydrogenase (short-subunit alcohol dehydrogenase family)
MLLDGKVSIVTGAGSGIGRASALRFAAEGAAVVVADVRRAKAEETAAEIAGAGGRAIARGVDVADAGQVEAMVRSAVEAFGRLDVLFNNAATTRLGDATALSLADWDLIWRTNVSSIFVAAKHAIPLMAAGGGGSIVSTASVSGLLADRGQVAYAASKAAVIGLTRALAVDHAADGVRVNCICPGMTATPPMVKAAGDGAARARMNATSPMGRWAEPEELAAAAAWLASHQSSYVTGQAIVVDGGLTAQSHFSTVSHVLGG